MSGSSGWMWAEPLWFSQCVAFHLPVGYTGFLMWGSQDSFQESEGGNCKASEGLGLEFTHYYLCPFQWSKYISINVEGSTQGHGYREVLFIGTIL